MVLTNILSLVYTISGVSIKIKIRDIFDGFHLCCICVCCVIRKKIYNKVTHLLNSSHKSPLMQIIECYLCETREIVL